MQNPQQVLVLWDTAKGRPRGKTHALDCKWANTVRYKIKVPGARHDGYREIDVDRIPPGTGRASCCDGGR